MDHHDAHGPLFIVGAPRSGTTLLYKALCLNPAAGYISNWVRRYPKVPQLAFLNRMARCFPKMQRAVWFGKDSNAYVYGSPRSNLERAFPMPVEGEPLYSHCGTAHYPQQDARMVERDQRTALALRSSFAAVQRYGGGQCLVSKRIANNQRIPLLHDAFPQARFIEIIRDGRAVAYSLSKVDWWPDSHVWWYGGSPRQWEEEGGDPWELCARDWVEEVQALEDGLSTVPEESVRTIHYERLVHELVPVLAEVASFAGFPEDTRWLRRVGELQRPAATQAWRHRLPEHHIATIERIQSPTLRRRGYDV